MDEFENEGAIRRDKSATLYGVARQKAAFAGLILKQHSIVHYSLRSPAGWLLNIYPGNRRLYYDRQHKKPPYLKVPEEWNLLDVIEVAIATQKPELSSEQIASSQVTISYPPEDKPVVEELLVRLQKRVDEVGKQMVVFGDKPITQEEIELRAYFLWEQAGRPEGDGQRFWLEAEKELS